MNGAPGSYASKGRRISCCFSREPHGNRSDTKTERYPHSGRELLGSGIGKAGSHQVMEQCIEFERCPTRTGGNRESGGS